MSYWELMQLKELISVLIYERSKSHTHDTELLDWFTKEVTELIK